MATLNYDAYTVNRNSFRALRDDVIVEEMAFKERKLASGLILLDDDGKGHGIRPRWGKVYAIGPNQVDVVPGQWIMVAHGRWSRGVKIRDENGETTIRKVDNNDILLLSDEDPGIDDTVSEAIDIYQR
jgi:co-chaperonin GroES (HSP10)